MPWCEPCAKYWTPNAMNDDGTCPACGDQVEPGQQHRAAGAAAGDGGGDGNGGDDDVKAPWHFKLMIAALTVYLGWRIVDIFV